MSRDRKRPESGLLAQRELHDRSSIGFLQRPPQQRVRLGRGLVGLQEVAAIEHDLVDLFRGYELDNLDLVTALLGQRFEVLLGEHNRGLALCVRLVDVGVLDDLAADLAPSLVTDPAAVGVVHLMQADVVVLGGGVELDGHIHQAKGDSAFPDRPHTPFTTHSAGRKSTDCCPLAPERARKAAVFLPRRHAGLNG